jgi:hypothetical protein
MKDRQEELVEMLQRQRGGNPKATTKDLPYITTLFRCSDCRQNISYPRVLVHDCLRQFTSAHQDAHGPIVYKYFNSHWKSWPWNTHLRLSVVPLPESWKELPKLCGVGGKALAKITWEECLRQGGKIEETVFRLKPVNAGREKVASLRYLVSLYF